MSKPKLGQEPAFPKVYSHDRKQINNTGGMSKRYVTTMNILCDLISNGEFTRLRNFALNTPIEKARKLLVEEAYRLADELLKQENK